MSIRPAAYRSIVCLLALVLTSCGFRLLQQGEPDFNTAILLPGNATAQTDSVRGTQLLTPTTLPKSCQTAETTSTVTATTATATTGGTPAAGSPAVGTPATTPTTRMTTQTRTTADDTASQAKVIQCVYEVKALIDDHYREYRITLHHFVDDGNAALDFGNLGLSTAATLIGAPGVKTTLSAFGTLLTGSKSVVNEDVLMRAAVESIINQMDADRQQQFGIMVAEMKGPSYILAQAKDDLLIYFADGTFDHALVSMQTLTAANSGACKSETDRAKVQAAQGTNPTLANTAGGCLTSEPVAGPPTVGVTVDIPSTLTATAGEAALTVNVTGITDDSVTITLSNVTPDQVEDVQVNGASQKPAASAAVTVRSAGFPNASGKGSVVFKLQNLTASESIDVIAKGRKGTQDTGPTTLKTVSVIVN